MVRERWIGRTYRQYWRAFCLPYGDSVDPKVMAKALGMERSDPAASGHAEKLGGTAARNPPDGIDSSTKDVQRREVYEYLIRIDTAERSMC